MPGKKKGEWAPYIKVGLTIFITVAACILFFFLVYRFDVVAAGWEEIMKVAEPIIFGLVFAYLLMPIKEFVEKHTYAFLKKRMKKEEKAKKIASSLGITGSVLFLLLIIAILLAIIIPAMISSIAGLIDNMQGYMHSFYEWFKGSRIGGLVLASIGAEEVTKVNDSLTIWMKEDLLPKLQSYLSHLQEYIVHITSGVVAAFRTLINFIVGIFIMVYVMAIKTQLVGQSKKIIYGVLPVKKANVLIETLRKANEIFGGFIIGRIIDSAIIGVLCYIGCLILRLPNAFLVAVIVGVTNVVQFFGPIVGALLTIPLVLIQSPIHGLYLAIFILLLQQLDGNVIGPKIIGDTTGLSAFWVMFSVLVAGGLFGFPGMILGVPTCALVYYMVQKAIGGRMEKRKLPKTTEEYVELQSIDEKTLEPIYKTESEEKLGNEESSEKKDK